MFVKVSDEKNPSYLKSVYAGVVTPIMYLPLSIWINVILLAGRAFIAVGVAFASLLSTVSILIFYGFAGTAYSMTEEEIQEIEEEENFELEESETKDVD